MQMAVVLAPDQYPEGGGYFQKGFTLQIGVSDHRMSKVGKDSCSSRSQCRVG